MLSLPKKKWGKVQTGVGKNRHIGFLGWQKSQSLCWLEEINLLAPELFS
jgi:hypothetical protein